MDDELKELLKDKADDMRVGPSIPSGVLRRSRRRRALTATLAGSTAVVLALGAFLGARAALTGNTAPPTGGPATQPPGQTVTQRGELWFTYNGSLFVSPTKFTTDGSPNDEATAALQQLLYGPGSTDSGAGVSTSIPDGTTVHDVSVSDGLARVTLSTHVESDPLSDAQVVYTLTQFSDVQRVLINDQEGGPLTRDDLAGQLPAILLEEPFIGDTVSSPVTISGTADVFEAVVSIQIIAGEGTKVADTTTMAECGTGCRGDFSKAVSFSVPQEETGTIVVFEASAKDGSPINVVRIPVTLEPGGAAPSQTGFDGIWPADDDAQLAELQAEAAAGHADWALQPDTTAAKFASDVAQWSPSTTVVQSAQTNGDQSYVVMWNRGMASAYSKDIALNVMLRKAGDVWIVQHADDGLFDLQCPSIRQDVFILGSPQQICGQFAQPPAGWIVSATYQPAGTALAPTEARQGADIPVQGDRFDGQIPIPASYKGSDVELIVTVYSGSGETLGLWARRFSTEG